MKERLCRLETLDHLGKEDDEGSIEYKWKLVGISEDRFEHLLTQMQFRVTEGHGECIYEVGVADDGYPKGLAEDEYAETIGNLQRMAERLQCDLSVLCEKVVQDSPKLKCAEVMVRKFGVDDFIDVRISMCGHAGSGKSTLVGVLTSGILDNGKGSARQKVFNHLHELETGLTSSISQQIIGFGACGNVVNYTANQLFHASLDRIAELSSKVCTLYDLAGHEKYLKTTVTGMTGTVLDYACLVIRADKGIQQMTREHLGLCCSLGIPFFCVVTCADLCGPQEKEALMSNIKTLLKMLTVPKDVYWVKDSADVIVCSRRIKGENTVPVFYASNVTGQSLDLLRTFLSLLPVRRQWDGLAKLPAEVVLDKWFDQVADIGTVVSGLVEQGCVCCGDQLFLGPNDQGLFEKVTVRSIQVKRVNVKRVEAGMHACYAISPAEDDQHALGTTSLRKGMVLVDPKLTPVLEAYWRFEADVTILFASGKIQNNFQPIFHCRMIRQKVRLLLLDGNHLRTGEASKVQFEFLFTAEYLKEGLHFVFIDGSTKGIGTITRLIRVDAPPARLSSPKPVTRGRCHSSNAPRTCNTSGPRPRFFSGRSPVSGEKIDWASSTSSSPLSATSIKTDARTSMQRAVKFRNIPGEFVNKCRSNREACNDILISQAAAVSNGGGRGSVPKLAAVTKKERRYEKKMEDKSRRAEERQFRKTAANLSVENTEFNVYAD